ncbi:hypothetical protein KIL84_011084 [Mauremys mutica]|uniref:Uncharacterized protein n=1 Tax=Mauremys mutica TaxID=74926 RepID=A0A9D3XCD9_9SAUR|nr:hypothetical protein KIL84_011084 [Mauremys mutica]
MISSLLNTTALGYIYNESNNMFIIKDSRQTQPSKTANHKLTIDTNKSPVSLVNLFPDFADQSDEDQVNVLGFQFLTGSRITLLASKTSQRYRIQSEQLEDLWLITKELTFRLEEHFKKQNSKDFTCTFSGSVPLQEYFELIDRHFELRLNAEKFEELLSERAIQFRAIERRLLTRFKDKTPAPLQHLDTLLEGTYRQVINKTRPSKISYDLFYDDNSLRSFIIKYLKEFLTSVFNKLVIILNGGPVEELYFNDNLICIL